MSSEIILPKSKGPIDSETLSWMKLLKGVSLNPDNSVDFMGEPLERGSRSNLTSLRPSAEYPEKPLVLEYIEGYDKGHTRRIYVYLWRWDEESRTWQEIAKGRGKKWSEKILSKAMGRLPALAAPASSRPEDGVSAADESTAAPRAEVDAVYVGGQSLEEEVMVPESPTIHQVTKRWARTLRAIDTRFSNGYAFIGEKLSPGSLIQPKQLRPTSAFPKFPLVLEFLQATGHGGQDKVVARLWQYDMGKGGGWQEVSKAEGYRWAKPLIEVALQYLPTGRNDAAPEPAAKPTMATKSPQAIWPNIKAYIDQETARLSPHDKLEVLEYLSRETQREMNICRAQTPDAAIEGDEELPDEEYL